MREIGGEEFGAQVVRRRIAMASLILAAHCRAGAVACSCSRPWPCPVAVSCADRRDQFQGWLALAEEPTVRFPVIRADPPTGVSGWRRLVRLHRRQCDGQRQRPVHRHRRSTSTHGAGRQRATRTGPGHRMPASAGPESRT
jgi:hypothetical protein